MKQESLQHLIIKATEDLPSEKLKEIAEFILFIRNRTFNQESIQEKDLTDKINKELTKLNEYEAMHVMEEFKDYKKLYPLE